MSIFMKLRRKHSVHQFLTHAKWSSSIGLVDRTRGAKMIWLCDAHNTSINSHGPKLARATVSRVELLARVIMGRALNFSVWAGYKGGTEEKSAARARKTVCVSASNGRRFTAAVSKPPCPSQPSQLTSRLPRPRPVVRGSASTATSSVSQ